MQEPKKDSWVGNEWTEFTISEQTLQQNKVYAIKIFSCNKVPSVNKMWYTRIWVLQYKIFPSNLQTGHNHPEILRVDDKYIYV